MDESQVRSFDTNIFDILLKLNLTLFILNLILYSKSQILKKNAHTYPYL